MRRGRSETILPICQRIIAAIFGGYALTVSASLCFTSIYTGPRIDAVLIVQLAGFLLYGLAVLWTFAVRSLRMVWLGLLIPSAALTLLTWFATQSGSA